MRILDEIEIFLTEEKDTYKLYPLDYDAESGMSFGVDISDEDETVAKVAIKTIDGVPIDALNGNYNYDDVYADVDIEGDTDDPRNADLMLWVLKKLKNMGYDEQSIRLDGESYYEKPETVSDITTDDDEPVESDAEFDPSSYWNDDNEDEDEKPDSDYQPPKEPSFEPKEDDEEESETDSESTSDEEDEDEEEK